MFGHAQSDVQQAFDQSVHDRLLGTGDAGLSFVSFGAFNSVGGTAFDPENRQSAATTAGYIITGVTILAPFAAEADAVLAEQAAARALGRSGEALGANSEGTAADLQATAKFKLPDDPAEAQKVIDAVNEHWDEFNASGGTTAWDLSKPQGYHGGNWVDGAFRAAEVSSTKTDTMFLYGNALNDLSVAAEELGHWRQFQGLRQAGVTNSKRFLRNPANKKNLEDDVESFILSLGFQKI